MGAGTVERSIGDDDGSGDAHDWERWTEEVTGDEDDLPATTNGGVAFELHALGRRQGLDFLGRLGVYGVGPDFIAVSPRRRQPDFSGVGSIVFDRSIDN